MVCSDHTQREYLLRAACMNLIAELFIFIPVIRAAPTSVYFTVFFQELFLNDCCFQR